MKKIISMALCAVMLLSTAIVSANAATTRKVISTDPYFELVGDEIYVPANKILKSVYNVTDSDYSYFIRLAECDNENNRVEIKFTDCQTSEKYVNVTTKEYYTWFGYGSSASRGETKTTFNSGAYYQKVRVRMCDFKEKYYRLSYKNGELVEESYSYFLENGNYYHYDTEHGEMTFDFTNVKDVQESGMIIISGATMTAVKPDKDGMVEFYIKRELDGGVPTSKGAATKYTGISTYTNSFGGSLNMGMGNVESDTVVNVKDATLIQKYCVDVETFNAVQKYFADVNLDGRINVIDATEIQKYCVES